MNNQDFSTTPTSAANAAAPLKIAVIGAGPRGLWAVEELFSQAQAHRVAIDIDVWDPAPPGSGTAYALEQPEYWTLNVTSRIVRTSLGLFDDWRRNRGESTPLAPFPPRRMVGRFFEESWAYLTDLAEGSHWCTLNNVRRQAEVEDLVKYDEVLLVTGHAADWPGSLAKDQRTVGVYPPEGLRRIPAGAIVASRGTALTFIDALLELTEGRGGMFEDLEGGRLEYFPSGQEPQVIYPVGRSGRFMEIKPEPAGDLAECTDASALKAACARVLVCSELDELKAVLGEYATALLRVTGRTQESVGGTRSCPFTPTVAQVIAGEDVSAGRGESGADNAVTALRHSHAVAVGLTAPDARWAVGQAFRQMYPAIVSRVSNQNRPELEGFFDFARILERVAFGPTAPNAAKLLALIDIGIVDCSRMTSQDVLEQADFLVDSVLAPQGVLPTTLLGRILAGRPLQLDTDGMVTVPGVEHLAVVGREAEHILPGADSLTRDLHSVIPRWARRIITKHRRTSLARTGAQATMPLTGRLEPWMVDLVEDTSLCDALLAHHGSPINVHHAAPVVRNIGELTAAGEDFGVDVRVFFARKANKTLSIVDAVAAAGHGVDVASECELRQVLARGIPAERIILSSAIKPASLLELAVASGVTISVDSPTEANRVATVAFQHESRARIAPRLAPDPAALPPTRFGASVNDWCKWINDSAESNDSAERNPEINGPHITSTNIPRTVLPLDIVGIHVHLHGYAAADRCIALPQALRIVDAARAAGHSVAFIDIGGGIPMSYLDNHDQWSAFLGARARVAVDVSVEENERFTWKNDPLRSIYPFYQQPTRGNWLRELLGSPINDNGTTWTAAEALASRALCLHLEPGRSILDGAGMTLARVAFTKTRSDGVPLIGLEMNRTQCRTTTDDILVDPILVPCGSDDGRGREVATINEGFLVGAYCIEDEVIIRRRMQFPQGIAVGDVIAIPNTGGYFMHILESASHQIPLAVNLCSNTDDAGETDGGRLYFVIDPVDSGRSAV